MPRNRNRKPKRTFILFLSHFATLKTCLETILHSISPKLERAAQHSGKLDAESYESRFRTAFLAVFLLHNSCIASSNLLDGQGIKGHFGLCTQSARTVAKVEACDFCAICSSMVA